MEFLIEPSRMSGDALIPSSKSHTIRALFLAAMAKGRSTIFNPLDSADGRSALAAVKALGAGVEVEPDRWIIDGLDGFISNPEPTIYMGNSGTSTRFVLGSVALGAREVTITGDESTSSRPMGPLLTALENLGAKTKSRKGKLPATVSGPILGGETEVDGKTSQYLSSLLVSLPLAQSDSVLIVENLNEKPYVDMTLSWLDFLGVDYGREGYSRFTIRGGQKYRSFERMIPGDFSSATFFACLGAIPGNEVFLRGLDMNDPQGDKAILGYLEKMGASVNIGDDGITVKGDSLAGVTLDLNATPDALPAMAALACLADGTTHLTNVPQARIKETDRIAVMAKELGAMGALCEERTDGLVIHGGARITGARVDGHGDHRVVMALSVLASKADGRTIIETAESVDVTFPNFAELFRSCGGVLSASE